MCEGPSVLSGPIPPDPSLFPEYYKRPVSARGRLEGNSWGESLALLNGPLAPDPALYPGCYSARVPHLPRVGPNATHILERNQKGEVGALLKLEGISLTPSTPKHTPAKRDYGKENVRRLREIQRRFREQEAQKEHAKPVPVKALWTSPKYQDISSRVMAQLQFQVKGHMVDFVRHNARAAGKTVIRRSQSMQNLRDKQPPSSVKGRVPQYLEERKEQWRREEEEKKKNMPDPSVPAGHSQMLDRERQETLKTLKE
ncbi:hypothetical protein P4O66_023054, partial [Electrophorus voltai]